MAYLVAVWKSYLPSTYFTSSNSVDRRVLVINLPGSIFHRVSFTAGDEWPEL